MPCRLTKACKTETLTFGVEIEAVFAFEQQRLIEFLKFNQSDASILEDIGPYEPSLRHKHYPLLPYTHWAIKTDQPHPETRSPQITDANGNTFRSYLNEPIRMVQALVPKSDSGENLGIVSSGKQSYYPRWSITNDCSIRCLSTEQTLQHFSDRIRSLDEAGKWDSWGVEFISPPRSNINAAVQEASKLLSYAKGTSSSDFGLSATESTGFHVHVGQPNNEPFDLGTLQHLSFLLITYEDAINALHAPHRRDILSSYPLHTQQRNEFLSNRDHWLREHVPEPTLRHVWNAATSTVEPRLYEQRYADLATIKRHIFAPPTAATDTAARLQHLVERMCPRRGHVVNLRGHITPGRPNTVEFRQHAGTLDAAEMRWWIKFCVGLVRLARRLAAAGGARAADPDVQTWEDVVRLRVEDLFELMGFEKAGRAFYRAKMGGYGAAPESAVFLEWIPLDPLPEIEGLEIGGE